MLNIGLVVGEKYFFHSINPIYMDEFLSNFMQIVIVNKEKPLKDLVSLLSKSNFLKLVSELNIDDKEVNTVAVADNMRIVRFMSKQRQIFFADGKYELFYDINIKTMSIAVINGQLRRSKIFSNVNNMGLFLSIIRDFMSKLCKVKNIAIPEPVSATKMNEALAQVKSNSVKLENLVNKTPKTDIESINNVAPEVLDEDSNPMTNAFATIKEG